MDISLSTGTLYFYPVEKAVEMANEAGFDGVELIVNQEFQRVNAKALASRICGMTRVLSLHSPFMLLDGWGDQVQSLQRSVDLAGHCGIPLVNFHPPSWLGMEFSFWRWMYRIMDFQREVGQGEVAVTIENMSWSKKLKINGHILSHSGKLIEFLQERNLFLTFDCTHMGSGKLNFINEFYRYYNSGRIRNIHFSDYGHGREHLIPGHGILPLTRFLNHLRNTGYNGTFTLELSPHEFPRDDRIILEMLREILAYLREETRQVKAGNSEQ